MIQISALRSGRTSRQTYLKCLDISSRFSVDKHGLQGCHLSIGIYDLVKLVEKGVV